MKPDDKDTLIPVIKNPYNLGSENEWYDCDGLDYEIDYFELNEDENTECKSEGQETTTVGERHAH